MSMLARGLRLAVSSAGITKAGVTGTFLNIKQINYSSSSPGGGSASPVPKEALDKLVKNNKVVVFMKGVPDEPKCGFSNAVVQILRMHGVSNYDSHDVLQDEGIRQGIKGYTNWPTIPQVFINGDFVGGCDIMIQMHQSGDLVKELEKAGIKSALIDAESTEAEKK